MRLVDLRLAIGLELLKLGIDERVTRKLTLRVSHWGLRSVGLFICQAAACTSTLNGRIRI